MVVADVAATNATNFYHSYFNNNLEDHSKWDRNTQSTKMITQTKWTKRTRSMVSNSLRTCPIAVHTEAAEHLTTEAKETTAVVSAKEMDVADLSRWVCRAKSIFQASNFHLSFRLRRMETIKVYYASILCKEIVRDPVAGLHTANMNFSKFKAQCQWTSPNQITINSLIRRPHQCTRSSRCGTRTRHKSWSWAKARKAT